MKQLVNDVVALCEQAGQEILSIYHDKAGFEVDLKDDNSPLTQADLAAHKLLVAGLSQLTPDIPILSEEGTLPDFNIRKQWQKYWLIDPLDGTKEFVKRSGEFTVNVALIDNNRPTLGVVYVPVLDITYAGCADGGAFKREKGQTQTITTRKVAATGIDIVASRSHGASAVDDIIHTLEARFGQVETTSMGSSLKLCLVAEGRADLYPRLALTAEWDTAAAQAVVEAAGGTVVDIDFNLMSYNTKDDILNPFFYVIGDTDIDWQNVLA